MRRQITAIAIVFAVLLTLLTLADTFRRASRPAAAPAPAPVADRTDNRASRSYDRPRPSLALFLFRVPAKPKVQVKAVKLARPAPTPKRTFTPVPRRSTAVNWDAIAKCESGGHWNHHSATAGLYWGGLQMDMSFWRSYHGTQFAARPDLATKAQQIAVAERAYKSRGLSPWPTCGAFG